MKKKNIIISSCLTIALCASMIVGSTFALFTSESKVNIAVTSGKVSVVASVDESSVETKQLYDTAYEAGANNMYEGVATFTDEGLTLEKFVPGDGIKFNLVVENQSTVSVKYRTIVACENDQGLFDGLVVNIGENNLYDGERHVAEWSMLAVDSQDEIVPISIELPETAGDEYQDKSCTISYMVEAVQGNAYTGPDAVVDRWEESELPEITPISGNMGGIQFPAAPNKITLEAAWTFKATDTPTTVQTSPYKNWICDFVIECDGDIALGELGLWGSYPNFGSLAFANPIALPEGQSLFMMTSVGMPLTYEMICTDVRTFDCGVFRGLVNPQMQGKTVTVSLCLINPEVAEELINEVASKPENQGKGQEEILLEVMKKENWAKYIGTDVLIANQTSYFFE